MTFIRRNVWELGGDWADEILWYARGVAAMKARALAEPTSWRFYAGMHGFSSARWQELGYEHFSAYVTGLIRYDLLLLGPHKYFNGDDWKSERMAELDAITVKEFHEAVGKLTYLERMINQTARRQLSDAERDAAMKDLVAMLRAWALKPKKPQVEAR